jgi:uncharacterized protein involved in exopolysaccharide biosynthesis
MTTAPLARDDERDPPPLRELLAHIYTRRRRAAGAFAAILGLAIVVSAIMPPHYRATASLAIMPSPEYTVREDAGSRASNNSALAIDQIMKAETEILDSDDLHAGAIHDLGSSRVAGQLAAMLPGIVALYPDLGPQAQAQTLWAGPSRLVALLLSPWRGTIPPSRDAPLDAALRRFSAGLRVLPSKDSNVISISFTHGSAEVAAHTLNVMLTRYAEQRRRIYDDPQFAVAQHEADEAATAVRRADAALTAFKASKGYSDYSAERDLLLKRRSQAQQSLADALGMQVQARARLTALDHDIRSLPASAGLYQETDTDTRLQSVNDRLVDLHARLGSARERYRDNSRMIVDLQAQIRMTEDERHRLAKDGTPSLRRSGRTLALDTLTLDRIHANADMVAATAQAASVRTEIDGLNADLVSLDADETRLAELSRQKAAADERFVTASRATAEQHLTEAEDARRLTRIRIIQPARIPQRPTWTKMLIVIAGFFFACLTTCGWLMIGFVRSTTFLTEAGLAYATGLPVLAVIPRVQTRMRLLAEP